jgi:hypothetical protein
MKKNLKKQIDENAILMEKCENLTDNKTKDTELIESL